MMIIGRRRNARLERRHLERAPVEVGFALREARLEQPELAVARGEPAHPVRGQVAYMCECGRGVCVSWRQQVVRG